MVRNAEAGELDAIDRRLLVALSRDGRRPAADLGKELGLSRQAMTERIHDLERRGVIRGYRADVDPRALGLGVRAHVRLTLYGSVARGKEGDVLKRLTGHPMVRSVYRVSGEDCFMAEVLCRRIEDVNGILGALQATGAVQSSRTAFVLEAVMEKAPLGPLEPELVELHNEQGGAASHAPGPPAPRAEVNSARSAARSLSTRGRRR